MEANFGISSILGECHLSKKATFYNLYVHNMGMGGYPNRWFRKKEAALSTLPTKPILIHLYYYDTRIVCIGSKYYVFTSDSGVFPKSH